MLLNIGSVEQRGDVQRQVGRTPDGECVPAVHALALEPQPACGRREKNGVRRGIMSGWTECHWSNLTLTHVRSCHVVLR